MKIHRSFLIIICILVMLLPACQQPAAKPAQSPSTSNPQVSTPAAVQVNTSTKTTWIPDGVISPGEYTRTATYNDSQISWSNDDTYIYAGIKAKTKGWVAVGFGAESMMKNADIIEGYVADGKAEVVDMFSTGETGPHPPDTQLGGTNDILEPAAKVDNGYTTVEFKRKLDTGDKYDKPLAKGANKIIWAYGSDPVATLKHMTRGSGEIAIQ